MRADELMLSLEAHGVEGRTERAALAIELVAGGASLLVEQLHTTRQFRRRALGQRAWIVALVAGGFGHRSRQQRVIPEVVLGFGFVKSERRTLTLVTHGAAELFDTMDA